MESFFASSFFQFVLFPIGSAAIGIGVKYATRNDQYAKFSKEDVAVGIDLILSAVLMFIVITTDRSLELNKINELLEATNGELKTANTDLEAVLKKTPVDQVKAATLQASVREITHKIRRLSNEIKKLSDKIDLAGWTIALMLFTLWCISTVVRKWGWKSDTEMTTYLGVTVPLAVGILSLVFVMAGGAK